MAVFKRYDGSIIDISDHIHTVEDTQEERQVSSSGTTELVNTSNIILNYYSTILPANITTQTIGSRTVYVINTSSTDLNGNIVLKAQLTTPLTPGNAYIMYLEPIEDSNTKTNIISMNFGTSQSYDFNNGFYVPEPIRRPVEGFGSNILFMTKLTPQDTLKSMIIQLYITTKTTATTKSLLKLSIKQLNYTAKTTTAIATDTEPGFMSVEDKFKLDDISNKAIYIENKLGSALFYSTMDADLVDGETFNTKLNEIGSSATSIIFTNTAIPNDKIATATLVSTEDSKYKI